MPPCRSTLGCIIPQPAISSQRPLRAPLMKATSISAEGSVNGKKDGRKRTCRSSLSKKLRRKSATTPFRSAKLTDSPIHRPSIWWNIGEWVASESTRYTRPGAITRSSGMVSRSLWASTWACMARIWTGLVWVRSSTLSPFSR